MNASVDHNTIRRGIKRILGVLIAYTGLTLIYTYPAVLHLDTHIIAGPWDGLMFLWTTWWGPHALFVLKTDPLFTYHLFSPLGLSLVFNAPCLLPSLISAPLQTLFGLVPAYNIMVMSTFVFSGLGTYLLTNEIVPDRRAAFISGVVFAFGHMRVSEILFLNLIQSHFLVLFSWSLLCMYKRLTYRWAIVAGIFATCLLYASYNLFLLAAIFGVLFLIFVPVGAFSERISADKLKLVAVLLAMVIVLGLPIFVSMLGEIVENGFYLSSPPSREQYHEMVPFWRWVVRAPLTFRLDGIYHHIRHASYLGWGAMMLALVSFSHWKRDGVIKFWTGITIVFMAIALGPYTNFGKDLVLDTNMTGLNIPLPFKFIREVPVLREISEAHRWGIVGWIGMSVLAGYGFYVLLKYIENQWKRLRYVGVTTMLIATTIIFLDFAQLPFPIITRLPDISETKPALQKIASDTRDCSVLEVPAGRIGDPHFSYYETIHGKPVYMDGQAARVSPDRRNLRERSYIISTFNRIYYENYEYTTDDFLREKWKVERELEGNRIGWVILSWYSHSKKSREHGLKRGISVEELLSMDAFVRNTFPVEDLVYSVNIEQAIEEWRHLPRGQGLRTSKSRVFRIYKLKLS
jgi:hypothetical protein